MRTLRFVGCPRTKLCACPICGNVLFGTSEAIISCCGIVLPPLEAEECDDAHAITAEPVEDEYYVTVDHPMTKEHYISFIAAYQDDGLQLVKLYPEGSAEARFKRSRTRRIVAYCNHHGLFSRRIVRRSPK